MKSEQANTHTIQCMGQGISLKSEMKNPLFKLNHYKHFLNTQSIVCATVYGQCLEYLVYITLTVGSKNLETK